MAKAKQLRRTKPEPVEVTIYTPAPQSACRVVVIEVSSPDRLIEVEMPFEAFWKAVCKFRGQPGTMTQCGEADDE